MNSAQPAAPLHLNPATEGSDAIYERRREWVFLILAGLFLGSLTMLNVIGITRFLQLGPLAVAVGVLPYPLTFICTDLISEFYGHRRANMVVWVGLVLNAFVLLIVWLGQVLPPVAPELQAPWQTISLAEPVPLPNGSTLTGSIEMFDLIYACTAGAVVASMIAYLTAQFCDVWLFHFWKRRTRGKHLWLRNNGSTLVSQFVDATMVVSITFGAALLAGDMAWAAFFVLLFSNYAFKATVALVDTIPIYFAVHWLKGFLQIDPNAEYATAAPTADGSDPKS